MRFKFECNDITYDESMKKVSFEFDGDSLDDVMDQFELFLLGCGYSFNGHIDIIDNYNNSEDPFKIDMGGAMPSVSIDSLSDEINFGDYNDDILHVRV